MRKKKESNNKLELRKIAEELKDVSLPYWNVNKMIVKIVSNN
jgi:hypothetical protein